MTIKVSVKYLDEHEAKIHRSATRYSNSDRWSIMLHASDTQYMFWSYAVKPTAKQLRRCKKVYRTFLPTIS